MTNNSMITYDPTNLVTSIKWDLCIRYVVINDSFLADERFDEDWLVTWRRSKINVPGRQKSEEVILETDNRLVKGRKTEKIRIFYLRGRRKVHHPFRCRSNPRVVYSENLRLKYKTHTHTSFIVWTYVNILFPEITFLYFNGYFSLFFDLFIRNLLCPWPLGGP